MPAYRRLDQAEVLADNECVGSPALVGKETQKDGRGVLDVCALARGHVVGNPEKAEQAHYVVEPDACRVARGAADGIDERLPLRAAQQPRVECGKAPILAVAEKFVGRRADAHAGGEVVPPTPRVESI